jgi:hypothetical protein
MIQNNEFWDLGDPELDDRVQPVIHDIAFRLGCIQPSPDLPVTFTAGTKDLDELHVQLQAARSEIGAEDTESKM